MAAILLVLFISVNTEHKSAFQGSLQKASGDQETTFFSKEIETLLTEATGKLSEAIQNATIIDRVRESNQKHSKISVAELLEIDKKWRATTGADSFIESFLRNDVALQLLKFQKNNLGFSEIFVTDMYGANVGQTNKTTDFYQADEAWWTDSFDEGRGKILHGEIEFDESAQTVAISLYVPILDPDLLKVIGVAKGVFNLDVLKSKL